MNIRIFSVSKNKLSKVLAPNCKAQVDTMPVNKTDEELERNLRASSALSDILSAQKHVADKDLMGDVKRLAKEQLKNLGKVSGKGS